MRISANSLLRSAVLLTLTTATSLAHAATDDSHVSAMRYVSLDVSGDNADSKQYSGTGSFTLGKYVWLQGTLGKLTDSSDDTTSTLGDLSVYGAGFGLKNEHLQFRLNFVSNKNDADYKQRDVLASLDWNATRFSVGVDGFHRKTENATDVPNQFPLLGPPTLHGEASQTGNGFGLHALFNITDQLSVSLGGMSYSYDDLEVTTNVRNTATQSQIGTLREAVRDKVRQQLQLQATSGVTRSLALLDSSFNAGLNYQFDSVGLNAQYARDKALDTGDIINTVSLGASVFLGEHWMLSPVISQSMSDNTEDVTFGGVSVSYNW